MKNLIFYSSKNSPGKHDATGAFEPEAKAFQKIHGGELVPIDCSMPANRRRDVIYDTLRLVGELDSISFFCHGWQTGVQFGFNKPLVDPLARIVAEHGNGNIVFNLYCCSTADGPDIGDESYPDDDEFGTPAPGTDGGFADLLRDGLCRNGCLFCKIVAHRTSGHCSKNPAGVLFEGDGSMYGLDEESYCGGKWIVDPHDDLWPAWKAALKGDLRFRFPFMSMAEIESELRGLQ